MKKILGIIAMLIVAVMVAIPGLSLFMNVVNAYDYIESNETTIVIDMSKDHNDKSYGSEMRLVSVKVNDEKINLSEYDNKDWVWHGDWGYIFRGDGESNFEMTVPCDAKSVVIEYVEQEGSGIASFYINDKEVKHIDMYRDRWLTTSFSVSYLSTIDKILVVAQIALIIFLLELAIFYILSNIKHKNEPIAPIQKGLGMFDLAKGLGMIAVVTGHTFEAVADNMSKMMAGSNLLVGVIGVIAIYGMMPMFFLASGYGFRVTNVYDTMKKQIRFWIKPFIIVFLGTALVCVARFILDNSFGMHELEYYLLPFLFGQAHEGYRFGKELFSIGPMWFGTALCFAWIILNAILNIKNKYVRYIPALIIVCAGYYLSIHDLNVWCIPQIMFVIISLYAGYFLREKNIFENEKKKNVMLYIFIAVACIIAGFVNGGEFSIASAHWGGNYIVTMIISVLCGTVILWGTLKLNPIIKGKLKNVKKIGRSTYYIFYIHTFEWLAIPWNKIYVSLGLNQVVGFVAILIVRSVIIFIIYKCVISIKKKIKRKSKK